MEMDKGKQNGPDIPGTVHQGYPTPEPKARFISERGALIEIAKSWRGHDDVNWQTTTSENIYLLILDARELDEQLLRHYEKVLEALREYHHALDTRQHGGVAADKFVKAVQEIANRPWQRGATLKEAAHGA